MRILFYSVGGPTSLLYDVRWGMVILVLLRHLSNTNITIAQVPELYYTDGCVVLHRWLHCIIQLVVLYYTGGRV